MQEFARRYNPLVLAYFKQHPADKVTHAGNPFLLARKLRSYHASATADDLLYFDNNATTALDPAVVDAMLPYLTELYGNPSSAYSFGARVGRAIDTAREQVAAHLGCEAGEILFTSCGSEGNNAAIQSALLADRDRKHIVTSVGRAQRDQETLRNPRPARLRNHLVALWTAMANSTPPRPPPRSATTPPSSR